PRERLGGILLGHLCPCFGGDRLVGDLSRVLLVERFDLVDCVTPGRHGSAHTGALASPFVGELLAAPRQHFRCFVAHGVRPSFLNSPPLPSASAGRRRGALGSCRCPSSLPPQGGSSGPPSSHSTIRRAGARSPTIRRPPSRARRTCVAERAGRSRRASGSRSPRCS